MGKKNEVAPGENPSDLEETSQAFQESLPTVLLNTGQASTALMLESDLVKEQKMIHLKPNRHQSKNQVIT